jgi:thiamine biosynthesis lipoprotein ApbE
MKDTNQVQKALESKAKKELQGVVDGFLQQLDKLNKTYSQPVSYSMKENRNADAKEFFHIRPGCLEVILKDMLVEAYLDPMVNKKTQELLNKLELL